MQCQGACISPRQVFATRRPRPESARFHTVGTAHGQFVSDSQHDSLANRNLFGDFYLKMLAKKDGFSDLSVFNGVSWHTSNITLQDLSMCQSLRSPNHQRRHTPGPKLRSSYDVSRSRFFFRNFPFLWWGTHIFGNL